MCLSLSQACLPLCCFVWARSEKACSVCVDWNLAGNIVQSISHMVMSINQEWDVWEEEAWPRDWPHTQDNEQSRKKRTSFSTLLGHESCPWSISRLETKYVNRKNDDLWLTLAFCIAICLKWKLLKMTIIVIWSIHTISLTSLKCFSPSTATWSNTRTPVFFPKLKPLDCL